jgi:hypothetical protein
MFLYNNSSKLMFFCPQLNKLKDEIDGRLHEASDLAINVSGTTKFNSLT